MIGIRRTASIFRFLLMLAMLVIALTCNAFAVTLADYDDVRGHWAEAFLERAVSDGLLNGSKGKLVPDSTVTGAEMATMLVRGLDLQEWEKAYPGTKVEDWYYRYAAIAQKACILPEDGSIDLSMPVSRMQVFEALGNAYKFDKSLINDTALEAYGDAEDLEGESKFAAAFLVTAGIVNGNENRQLEPMKNITRAELVKLLYGIKDAQYVPAPPAEGDVSPLSGVRISLHAPDVEVGAKVEAVAEFYGVRNSFDCSATWYYNGIKSEEYSSVEKHIAAGEKSSFSRVIDYKRYMSEMNNIALELSYGNPENGITTNVFAQKTVSVKNYPQSYYDEKDGTAATNSDISHSISNPAQKNNFINKRGYASGTGYLIWVNRAAQTVNVFTGNKNNWNIVREMRCATGASATPTPAGITYITYKQRDGWTTDRYTVKPVVRFYPNSGYAFHSILYYPGTAKIKDGRLGRPASHGCVRMAGPDIWWLFNNVPVRSTVVIS